MELFEAMKEELGDLPIIAEDLGFLTDSVRELLKEIILYRNNTGICYAAHGQSDIIPVNIRFL